MTQRQRENIARYLYDLSKILVAAAVVGNLIAWQRFDMVSFLLGGTAALICFWWGFKLDETGD